MRKLKVVDFINKLNEIGYDENTELEFSCINGDNGNWYALHPDDDEESPFSYGENLTGKPYSNDCIDFILDVDGCKDYLDEKTSVAKINIIDELDNALANFYMRITQC